MFFWIFKLKFSMYNSNVHFQCTISMYNFNVQFQCTFSVYNFNVQFQCTISIYNFNVQFQCKNVRPHWYHPENRFHYLKLKKFNFNIFSRAKCSLLYLWNDYLNQVKTSWNKYNLQLNKDSLGLFSYSIPKKLG